MDCIQAQSVISEALDGSPVDAAALDAAKSHCRQCAQCGQFIRTLSAVRRAAPPSPPEDLADRVMAAIRAEAAAAQLSSDVTAMASPSLAPVNAVAAGAAAALSPPEAGNDAVPGNEPAAGVGAGTPASASPARVSVGRRRMDRQQLITWGSVAAVLLVVVGVSAALGIMRLVGGTNTQVAMTDTMQRATVENAPELGAESGESAAATADAGSATLATPESTGEPASLYVNFNSDVYVLQGVSPQPKSELTQAGQTRMTFSADTPAALHAVFTGAGADTIYIENGLDDMQRFVLVKRGYRGVVYTLRSGDISEYGSWPTVPPGVPLPDPPDNPTGAPAFVLDGQDASGTPVYRRAGSSRQSGIAIAPGTAAPDPAANNPGWTWWTP